MRNWTHL